MKTPQDTQPEAWHRFFGATANNRAWDLAELADDAVDHREMLDAAHAAAWHWQRVGTELNRMRAAMLLAEAHAKAGLGRTALAYADEMRAYFEAKADTPDWEIAFVHVVHAHAASAADATDVHARSYAQATRAIGSIAEANERAIVERVFRNVAAP